MADVPQPTAAQVGAFDAGQDAYNTGQPSTTCPFRNADAATDPDLLDLRILWIRGWVLARQVHLYSTSAPPNDPQLSTMAAWVADTQRHT